MPKRERSKDLKIPSYNDVSMVIASYQDDLFVDHGKHTKIKHTAARKMIPILNILANHGLRIGAIQTLNFDSEWNFTGVSKGKKIKGQLSKREIEIMLNNGFTYGKAFADITKESIQFNLSKRSKALAESGVIPFSFNCHSLRHMYAVLDYSKNKDLYRLSRLLDHASITITVNYLASIDVTVE